MKARDLRNISAEEAEQKISELRRKMMDLNFQRRTARVEKPHAFYQIRKDIARIMTVIREKKK